MSGWRRYLYKVHGLFQGETVSDRKHFLGRGFRGKFRMDKNSIKIYKKDKNLRVETTINNPHAFKIRDRSETGQEKWKKMGKSIANLYRYAEVSKACNMRYLESLSNVDNHRDIDKQIQKLCVAKLGEGLVIANNAKAGNNLMQYRWATKNKAVVPEQNQEAIHFLLEHGYTTSASKGTRMVLGKWLEWQPEKIFSRIGGNFG